MPKKILWLPTKQASEALDLSPIHLRRLRHDGLLQIGKHYRNIARPQAVRPTYQWNVDAIEALLAKPQSHR